MHRGIPRHMTSRNKELLEDIVSSLWELETARQRQERLVLGVLATGGDTETPTWQQNAPVPLALSISSSHSAETSPLISQKQLRDAPGGVLEVLQQQLSELTVDTNTEDNLHSVSSSGFYEQSEIQSTLKHSRSSPSLSFYSHRGRSAEDAYMLDWGGQRARPLRSFLPRSFSAPYTTLEGIAEGIEDDEDDDDDGTLWSKGQTPNGEDVNEPHMSPIMNLNEDGGPIVSHSDHQVPIVEEDEEPTAEDIQQAMRVETYILGLLQRYCINQTPTSPTPDCWQELNAYPTDYCEQPEISEWQQWEMCNNEKESQNRLYLEDEANRFSQACKDPTFSIESSSIIADIDSHYLHHSIVSLPSTSESPKQDWESTSLDTPHQLPIARMYQEESWPQKHLKTISQAQSEGNFRSQGFNTKLEQEYPLQGWDMDMHRFNEDYISNQRLWSSAADLGREEKVMFCRAEERPPRDANLPLQINPHLCLEYNEHDQRIGNDMNARRTQGDGSDSSPSETCSPGSSSMSSDSDESGGLVWPQEVPPGVPSFSQNAPTAMVRIKASHALKRKILRFRSGSLKVMTTV